MPKVLAVGLTDTHQREDNLSTLLPIFELVASLCHQHGVNTVFHLGDWMQARKGQRLDVLAGVDACISAITKYGYDVCTIPGNHDKTDLSSPDSYLDVYRHHPSFYLFDGHDDRLLDSVVQIGDTTFFLLPFFSDELYLEKLEKLAQKAKKTVGTTVLLTHQAVTGVLNNDGSPVESAILVSNFKAFSRVLVGHYHDPQVVNPNIEYVGSTHQGSFGENQTKGVFLICDDGSIIRQPTPFPRYTTLDHRLSKESLPQLTSLLVQAQSLVDAGEKVRLKVRGTRDDLAAAQVHMSEFSKLGVTVRDEVVFQEGDGRQAKSLQFDRQGLEDEWRLYAEACSMSAEAFGYGLKLLSGK